MNCWKKVCLREIQDNVRDCDLAYNLTDKHGQGLENKELMYVKIRE